MEEEADEIFRGPLEKCLARFGEDFTKRVPKGSKIASRAKQPIAEFCDVDVPTVTRWFTGVVPVGLIKIKLMCYLDLIGYHVTELRRMRQQGMRGVFELMGFGLMTPQEAVERLTVSTESQVFQIFWGNLGVTRQKSDMMWEMWKEKRELLDARKAEVRLSLAQHEASLPRGKTVAPALHPPTKSLVAQVAESRKIQLIGADMSSAQVAVSLMDGLLYVLNRIPLGDLPDEETATLRGAARTMLRISSRLTTMSTHLLPNGEGG